MIKYEQNSMEGDALLVVKSEVGKEDEFLFGEDVIIELNRLAKENAHLKRRLEDNENS